MKSETGHKSLSSLIALLALTIFVSAFLLFQVQPLISKFILPWFGGSPAVWTTAMLFFQCSLFLGYLYAHVTSSNLDLRQQTKLHVVLLIIASVLAFFVIPGDYLKPTSTSDPTFSILKLLAICVGLPYFMLSTTGPLIQAWFSHARPGSSPYRLFALSNFGSLLALGSFPILFEPYFELPTMGRFWMYGFWAFASLCTLSAMYMLKLTSNESHAELLKEHAKSDHPIHASFTQVLCWIGLPALASLTFIATTNHVCHDIATTPFLWVIPLALYLITFIICFDHERWYKRGLIGTLCCLSIFTLVEHEKVFSYLFKKVTSETKPSFLSSLYSTSSHDSLYHLDLELDFIPTIALHFITMFLICLVCHGELVKLRPARRELITKYYLMISAGGACGGLFISLIATNFFLDYHEWPLSLLCAFIIAGAVVWSAIQRKDIPPKVNDSRATFAAVTAILLAAATIHMGLLLNPFESRTRIDEDQTQIESIHRKRNFFGTISVSQTKFLKDIPAEKNNGVARTDKDNFRTFRSGSIIHGQQLMDPELRNRPLSYYNAESGVGQTLTYCQTKSHKDRPLKYAVVGLGVGSLAAYARPAEGARAADECVIYEINPLVEDVARDFFWYLPDYEKRLGKKLEVRLGDARLTMEKEAEQNYDVIILDAFSGDSVPAHLLTREAFEIYKKHLRKKPDGSIDGTICVHITNSFLNLYPVAKNAAEQVMHLPYTSIYLKKNARAYTQRSYYFMISSDKELLASMPAVPRYETKTDPATGKEETVAVNYDWPNIPLWTDHYSTIFKILLTD